MDPRLEQKAEVVMVGAGPIGLVAAIQLAEAGLGITPVLIERHKEYLRTQRLHMDLRLLTSANLRAKLLALVPAQAQAIDEHHLNVPIQDLENLLLEEAKKLNIQIIYKQFITPAQLAKELAEHKMQEQKELEQAKQTDYVVGLDEVQKLFPDCKIIIGSDGSRSAVRETFEQDEADVKKTDLRNLIELQYTVEGKVKELAWATYVLSQPLLDGFLCSEHIAYDEAKKRSHITLRFIVDKETYNDPTLNGVNAKNLHPLSAKIPERLKRAINIWLNTRGDNNIVMGSSKLNKITLSIYTSRHYAQAVGQKPVILIGDSSCGFPFMKGYNLGVENCGKFVTILSQHWAGLQKGDQAATQQFIDDYALATQATYEKGTHIVAKANNKLARQEKLVSALHYSSFPVKTAISFFFIG